MLPDLSSLELFLNTLESRSISKGAERSHIALAAASRRITMLEDMLGVTLLDRSSRGVEATPAGLALAAHARQLLQSVERLKADLSEYARGMKGRVRLHANTSAMTQFLPEDIAEFSAQYPDVRFELEERRSLEIIQAVALGAADVGIIVAGPPTEGLESFPYRTDQLVVVLPRSHPLRSRSTSFEQLLDYDFVCLDSSTSITRALLDAAAASHRTLRLRVQVWSFEAMCRMVQAGIGIGVLPESGARAYAGALGLRLVPLIDEWAKRRHVVCVRETKALPAHVRRLVEHLSRNVA